MPAYAGPRLVSVQKLLGHSDPKIKERRYGHLLPGFMESEVDRLRFGIDQLAPRECGGGQAPALHRTSEQAVRLTSEQVPGTSQTAGQPGALHPVCADAAADGRRPQGFAAPSPTLGIPLVSGASASKREAGTPSLSRGIPASWMAGCTGLEPVASGVTGRRYIQLN